MRQAGRGGAGQAGSAVRALPLHRLTFNFCLARISRACNICSAIACLRYAAIVFFAPGALYCSTARCLASTMRTWHHALWMP